MEYYGFQLIEKPTTDLELHNNEIYNALKKIATLSELIKGVTDALILETSYELIRDEWLKVTSLLIGNLDPEHTPYREKLNQQSKLYSLLETAGVAMLSL